MPESGFNRLWHLLKPPDVGNRPAESLKVLEMRRRQRRLITITIAVAIVIVAGLGVFAYIGNAPQRAEREFQEGMKLMRPGKYPDAVTHFTHALDMAPQRADAYLERGNAHRSLGEDDAALADFHAAADLDPSLPDPHNGMALIYLDRHDQRHALEELSKSVLIRPTIEGYYQRGQIFEAQGDHRKAVDDYDLAIALARDAPYVYRARALAKENLGDQEGARADRDTATDIERHR